MARALEEPETGVDIAAVTITMKEIAGQSGDIKMLEIDKRLRYAQSVEPKVINDITAHHYS